MFLIFRERISLTSKTKKTHSEEITLFKKKMFSSHFTMTADIVYRNTWLGNYKVFINDLIANIILDNLKKSYTIYFTIPMNKEV